MTTMHIAGDLELTVPLDGPDRDIATRLDNDRLHDRCQVGTNPTCASYSHEPTCSKGPGGVGETTIIKLVADLLDSNGVPVHTTLRPSRSHWSSWLGTGPATYRDMPLACLCSADRHHQPTTEILPAPTDGKVVLCDR